MWVKICGLKKLDQVLMAAELGADAVGFVFERKSPRYVTPAEAVPQALILGKKAQKVGVFWHSPALEVAGLADAAQLDFVQIHPPSKETLRPFVAEVRRYLKLGRKATGIILALSLGEGGYTPEGMAEEVAALSPDMVLVESPKKEGLPGGQGKAWEWGRLQDVRKAFSDRGLDVPLILAGGLNPGNVQKALEEARPDGVDVSSGVEKDGQKDRDSMAAFLKAVREWQAHDGVGG